MIAKLGISLKEPSTWVGIISLLGLIGVQVAPEYQTYIVNFGVALGALLGVIFKWEPAAKSVAEEKPEQPLEELVRENQE